MFYSSFLLVIFSFSLFWIIAILSSKIFFAPSIHSLVPDSFILLFPVLPPFDPVSLLNYPLLFSEFFHFQNEFFCVRDAALILMMLLPKFSQPFGRLGALPPKVCHTSHLNSRETLSRVSNYPGNWTRDATLPKATLISRATHVLPFATPPRTPLCWDSFQLFELSCRPFLRICRLTLSTLESGILS